MLRWLRCGHHAYRHTGLWGGSGGVHRRFERRQLQLCSRYVGGEARLAELERGGEDLVATKRKLAMALELVGEKEEDIEHLYGDLADLKRLYREHVDELYAG